MNQKIVSTAITVFLIGVLGLQAAEAAAPAYLARVSSSSFLPPTIYAGDIVTLAVDVESVASTLSIVDLNGVLDVGNQFEAVDLEDNIPIINPTATKTLVLKFRVKDDTLPGYYPSLLTMSYLRYDEIVTQTESILIPVSKAQKNIDVSVKPSVINPGKQTEVVFTIKNVGGTPVSNISFSWSEASELVLPVGSDNKRFISTLTADGEAKIYYTIAADPNIEPGIYPLDVNMTFSDVEGIKTQRSKIGLIVGGTTDFEVSAETLENSQLSISIANIGSNNANAVVVRIPRQPGIRVSGSNIAILGNLIKGDYTVANFQVQSTATTTAQALPSGSGTDGNVFRERWGAQQAAQDLNAERMASASDLIIEIDYTDTTGERQSVQKTVQLGSSTSRMAFSTRTRTTDNQLSTIAWALLAVIAAAGIAFNKFKAGDKNWKRLGMVIALIALLFLAVVFLLNSELTALAVISVVSAALLARFFRASLPLAFLRKKE